MSKRKSRRSRRYTLNAILASEDRLSRELSVRRHNDDIEQQKWQELNRMVKRQMEMLSPIHPNNAAYSNVFQMLDALGRKTPW